MAEREALRDDGGRVVATFVRGTRDGLPLADDVSAADGTPLPEIADVTAARLRGHIVETTAPLGDLLLARGATLRRRSVLMTCDPAAPRPAVPTPPGVLLGPAQGVPAEALLDAYIEAYPPGHPDHHAVADRDGHRELLAALVGGTAIGPLMACARTAATGGRLVGAALVVDMPGEPPLCGPWLGELFRHPDAPPGTGAALLAAALDRAASDGLPRVGLRVSAGNPARRLYDAFGFTQTRSSVAVLVGAE